MEFAHLLWAYRLTCSIAIMAKPDFWHQTHLCVHKSLHAEMDRILPNTDRI